MFDESAIHQLFSDCVRTLGIEKLELAYKPIIENCEVEETSQGNILVIKEYEDETGIELNNHFCSIAYNTLQETISLDLINVYRDTGYTSKTLYSLFLLQKRKKMGISKEVYNLINEFVGSMINQSCYHYREMDVYDYSLIYPNNLTALLGMIEHHEILAAVDNAIDILDISTTEAYNNLNTYFTKYEFYNLNYKKDKCFIPNFLANKGLEISSFDLHTDFRETKKAVAELFSEPLLYWYSNSEDMVGMPRIDYETWKSDHFFNTFWKLSEDYFKPAFYTYYQLLYNLIDIKYRKVNRGRSVD